MKCVSCQREIPDGVQFCPICGEFINGYNVAPDDVNLNEMQHLFSNIDNSKVFDDVEQNVMLNEYLDIVSEQIARDDDYTYPADLFIKKYRKWVLTSILHVLYFIHLPMFITVSGLAVIELFTGDLIDIFLIAMIILFALIDMIYTLAKPSVPVNDYDSDVRFGMKGRYSFPDRTKAYKSMAERSSKSNRDLYLNLPLPLVLIFILYLPHIDLPGRRTVGFFYLIVFFIMAWIGNHFISSYLMRIYPQFCKDRTLPEFMEIVENICFGRYWLQRPRNKKFLAIMGICSIIPFLILSF